VSSTVTSIKWDSRPLAYRYGLSALAGAAALMGRLAFITPGKPSVFNAENAPMSLIIALFSLASILLLFGRETHIDSTSGSMVQEWRLFDRLLMVRRRYRLSDFAEVAMKRQCFSNDGGRRTGDILLVGLRRASGKFVPVCYFNTPADSASLEAEQTAQSLVVATGLPRKATEL